MTWDEKFMAMLMALPHQAINNNVYRFAFPKGHPLHGRFGDKYRLYADGSMEKWVRASENKDIGAWAWAPVRSHRIRKVLALAAWPEWQP